MAKVANTGPFKNFPGWNPVEKRKNYGQNQQASHMEPFGGNLWHCASSEIRKSWQKSHGTMNHLISSCSMNSYNRKFSILKFDHMGP